MVKCNGFPQFPYPVLPTEDYLITPERFKEWGYPVDSPTYYMLYGVFSLKIIQSLFWNFRKALPLKKLAMIKVLNPIG